MPRIRFDKTDVAETVDTDDTEGNRKAFHVEDGIEDDTEGQGVYHPAPEIAETDDTQGQGGKFPEPQITDTDDTDGQGRLHPAPEIAETDDTEGQGYHHV